MPLVINDAFLPATFYPSSMTDEDFAQFCAENPDLRIETTAEGELLVMAPTHPLSGDRNSQLAIDLGVWARNDGRGRTYDSSTLFMIPNGARRSPDASWILKSRIKQISPAKRRPFWHICPDFVIELKSDSDRLPALKNKMLEYRDNGAHLGWLINPEDRSVIIYRPNLEPETLRDIVSIKGNGLLEGFVLDLSEIWEPFE
jgi:Uma2 family endonuclease